MKEKNIYPIIGFSAFVLFLLLSFLIYIGRFENLDYLTTVSTQNVIPGFLITPFSLFSIIGTAEITAGILLLVLLFFAGIKKLYIVGLFIFLTVIEIIGKTFIQQAAPPEYFQKTNLFLGLPAGSVAHDFFAYPSGHSARTAFISALIIVLVLSSKRLTKTQKRIGILLVLFFDFVMFISRIYLGEHWATDVVGGALLGFSVAFIGAFLFQILENRKTSSR